MPTAAEIVRGLNVKQLRERIDELESERQASLVLLRAALRKPIVTMLLQCYLQQPFVNQHNIADWANLPAGEEPEEREDYPTQVVESPDGELPYSPGDQWSDGAKTFVYTFSTMCSRYITTQCRAQLPVAMSPGSGQQNTSQVFQLAPAQCQRTIDLDVRQARRQSALPARSPEGVGGRKGNQDVTNEKCPADSWKRNQPGKTQETEHHKCTPLSALKSRTP